MMIKRQTAVFVFFILLFSHSPGQITKTEQLIDVVSKSIDTSYSPVRSWIASNRDSMFFKKDTIRLYNSLSYRGEVESCDFIEWTFINKFHYRQDELEETCSEPGMEKVFKDGENLYSFEYVQKKDFVCLFIYNRKSINISQLDVIAIDEVILVNSHEKCYCITMVRHPIKN